MILQYFIVYALLLVGPKMAISSVKYIQRMNFWFLKNTPITNKYFMWIPPIV